MRLVGAALIVGSCGAMGLIIANGFSRRINNLRQLFAFVQCLDSEMLFKRSTLPEVIKQEADHFSGLIQDFLLVLQEGLNSDAGQHFSVIWEQGMVILRRGGFPRRILEELSEFGRILGRSDLEGQAKQLKLVSVRLEEAIHHAEKEREQHSRLWQYLGFSAGLLVVLLLL